MEEERDPGLQMGPAGLAGEDAGVGQRWRRKATLSRLATLKRLLGAALYRDLPR